MHLSQLTIENFRQFGKANPPFTLELSQGVTALVGENDAGKSAIIDAIRYALLTRDIDYIRVQYDDFHIDAQGVVANDITIRCKLSDLNEDEKAAFVEHLTYENGDTALYIHWAAHRLAASPLSRRLADVSVRSGTDGGGPTFELPARQLLSAAYLRPLRNAEHEMAPGNGSRLSQILTSFKEIDFGDKFNSGNPPQTNEEAAKLALSGMADYFGSLVNQHLGIQQAQNEINTTYLPKLTLAGSRLYGRISFTQGSEATRLRNILERLQLDLLEGPTGTARGRYGLGSNNLLYMACELLLLGKDEVGLPLLVIEEPEAHLHPQRQLRLMDFLESATRPLTQGTRPVQVIVTTHSPNLASKITLNNIALLSNQVAYSLAEGKTKLTKSDYRFLERFLDTTKANLFFARGVIIVEGDAEGIIIPALARLLGRDLAEHGVSIVNVGSTGLRRYSRIFQRTEPSAHGPDVYVSCLADMDVMPDCAPSILKLVTGDDDPAWHSTKRRWQAKRHFTDSDGDSEGGLAERRAKFSEGDSKFVKTFVSDQWTLEYDLAFYGLAAEVYISAELAKNDDAINSNKKKREDVVASARSAYADLSRTNQDQSELCSRIYALFKTDGVSKAVAAQYLVEVLESRIREDSTFKASLPNLLPRYIVNSIHHATRGA